MIGWEQIDEFGNRTRHAAWAICLGCGFAAFLHVPNVLAQHKGESRRPVFERLRCLRCRQQNARVITLRVSDRGFEKWQIETDKVEPPPMPTPEQLHYTIERTRKSWFPNIAARIGNDVMAKAAFAAETRFHEAEPLRLRQGGIILEKYRWPKDE